MAHLLPLHVWACPVRSLVLDRHQPFQVLLEAFPAELIEQQASKGFELRFWKCRLCDSQHTVLALI
jgi:hypothetical protein